MIDFYKPLRLRNGSSARALVVGQYLPYEVSGEAMIDGVWDRCTWTRNGHFSLCPDPEYPDGDPYDLVNVEE